MANVILAVLAHPDDEVLACGGTLARYAREGATVCVLTFTDGVSSRGDNPEAVAMRRREHEAACALLGAVPVGAASFPDQQLDGVPSLMLNRYVEAALADLQPDTVITHWPHDNNADHRAVAQAVLVATRPVAGSCVRRILAAEIPESTSQAFGAPPFAPTVFVPIEAHLQAKRDALACYASEMRQPLHPRSEAGVIAWAEMRGSQSGRYLAEAFALLREIV